MTLALLLATAFGLGAAVGAFGALALAARTPAPPPAVRDRAYPEPCLDPLPDPEPAPLLASVCRDRNVLPFPSRAPRLRVVRDDGPLAS